MSAATVVSGTVATMTDDLHLGDLRTIKAALSRLPNGAPAVDLAARLGLWTSSSHAAPVERKAFPSNVAALDAVSLTNEMGYWTSEFGRIAEINGALSGQRELNKLRLKSARAAARARVRRSTPATEKLTVAQINDRAEEDTAVTELDEQAGIIELLSAHARAAQEATTQYINTLSREITWRTAHMSTRSF